MIMECAKQNDINELYELQLLAFESEAEMIGSRAVPALLESYEEAVLDFENWTVFKTVNENGKIIGSIPTGCCQIGRTIKEAANITFLFESCNRIRFNQNDIIIIVSHGEQKQ